MTDCSAWPTDLYQGNWSFGQFKHSIMHHTVLQSTVFLRHLSLCNHIHHVTCHDVPGSPPTLPDRLGGEAWKRG